MFTVRLEEQRVDRFAELFAESLPAGADEIYAELGVTRQEALRLPLQIGELRQVVEEGEVAGYAWIELRERTLHVHALLLEPEFRGVGLTTRVLDDLEDEFGDRIDDVAPADEHPGLFVVRKLP